jgi:hypothetical protein
VGGCGGCGGCGYIFFLSKRQLTTTTHTSMLQTVASHHNQMNQRMYDRNVPSAMLPCQLDFRPATTKYSYFPVVEPRVQPPTSSIQQQPSYNQHTQFHPGIRAPWSGYQVNTESVLRNQVYALQKDSQAVYVPSSRSDLYHQYYPLPSTKKEHDHEHFRTSGTAPQITGMFYVDSRNTSKG